jgi:hypothetical protein
MVDLALSQIFVGAPLAHHAGGPHAYEPVLADAPGTREVAIEVAKAFPGANGAEVGRAQGGRLVLADRQVGDSVHTYLAVGPGLGPGPLDQVIDVLGLGVSK